MISSLFLAKLFGILLVVVTFALLANKKNFDMVLKFYGQQMAILAKGLVNIIFAVLLLLYHNAWNTGLDATTSLFCWFILAVGIVNLFFPKHMTTMVKRVRSLRVNIRHQLLSNKGRIPFPMCGLS